jgi:NADH dehydrogenase
VRRIVHISIANPAIDSPLPYYRGKGLVERALAETAVPYSIVRPTWIFGGERRDVLANNIAWILRHMQVFALPAAGATRCSPSMSRTSRGSASRPPTADPTSSLTPPARRRLPSTNYVQGVRRALRRRAPIIHVPPVIMAHAARALGLLLRDVVLTPDEISGLTSGLLVSHQEPLGRIAFSEWLAAHSGSIGCAYANELERHSSLRPPPEEGERAAGARTGRVPRVGVRRRGVDRRPPRRTRRSGLHGPPRAGRRERSRRSARATDAGRPPRGSSPGRPGRCPLPSPT